MRWLKLLEDENVKLRKLMADLSLDREMLQDVIRRKLRDLLASASWPTRFVMSGRCRSRGPAGSPEVDVSTNRYRSCRRDQAGLEARIKEICVTCGRYG